jgi:hypothetical protein
VIKYHAWRLRRSSALYPFSLLSPKLPCRKIDATTGFHRHNLCGATMTVSESKNLMKGDRVYWRGDAADFGTVTERSWDAVTIAWNNGQVSTVHHGDMREIHLKPTNILQMKT